MKLAINDSFQISDMTLSDKPAYLKEGTPVLDIKPYLREFAPRGETRQPQWASELMRDYWE